MGTPSRTSKKRNLSSAGGTGLEVLRDDALSAIPWLVHGFSTRAGGVSNCFGGKDLNLGLTPDDTIDTVERNRALFAGALQAVDRGGRAWPLVQARQIHSATVHVVDAVPGKPPAGDGLITATSGLLLTIKTADCVPVLVADTRRKVIGAFHAGWRGTLARIVEKGIGEMRRHFGSDARDIYAAIGPCIRKCCYSVGSEVRGQFESQFSYAHELFEEVFDSNALHVRYPLLFLNQRAPGHGDPASVIHLDLVAANARQLEAAGVPQDQVSVVDGCTACDTKRFFSHRAELGKTGRLMAAIGIRPR